MAVAVALGNSFCLHVCRTNCPLVGFDADYRRQQFINFFSLFKKKRFFYCFYLFIFIYLINFEVECTRREKEMMGRCRGGTWKPVFPPRMWNQLPLLGSDPVYRPQQFNQFFSAYLKKIIFYIICIYLFKNYLIIKYN